MASYRTLPHHDDPSVPSLAITSLCYPPVFPAGEWERWYRQNEPETSEMPSEWESKCNELQRMILVRCLRPDRVIFSATSYVANALGRKVGARQRLNA